MQSRAEQSKANLNKYNGVCVSFMYESNVNVNVVLYYITP